MNSLFYPKDDDGLSLIELIVAVLVSGIILVTVAMILVNSWRAQEDVVSVSEATNRGQLIGSAIEKAVRNAVYVTTPNSDTLLVRTALSEKCFGFHIGPAEDVTGGSITTVTTTVGAGPLPATTSWPIWDPQIELDGSKSSLTKVGTTVRYVFVIETDASPVRIQGEVAQRSNTDSGGTSC